MSKKKKGFVSSLVGNMDTFYYYVKRFSELSMAMFDWQNLPDTVDPRYLEMALFEDGWAIYFRDEVVGDLVLSAVFQGGYNPYGYPIRRRAISRYSSYNKMLTDADSVLIYNNLIRTNTYPTMVYFARRLWNLDRIVDVNANAQKTPILVSCTEDQKLTAENMYKEYDGNEPVIFSYKGLSDMDMLKVLKTDAPFVAPQIYQLKVSIFNEALTYLGIPNSITNKRERQIKDEVQRDLGGTLASRYSRLVSRQRACELINKKFGTDIWVEYRDEESVDENVQASLEDLQNRTVMKIGGSYNE